MNPKPPDGTLMQDLRALPSQYWILFSGTLINRFGHFVIPFLAIYLRREGYGADVIGLTLGAYGAGALLAGGIGGYMADRLGRKPTMIISCVGAAVFMIVLSQAREVPALVAATFMSGLFSAMYYPAGSALIADMVPRHLRVRAFACQRLAINFGFAAGMAVAGFMAEHSFFALFVVDALTTLLLGAAIWFGLKIPPRPASPADTAGWFHALAHMKRNPSFQLAAGASFLIAILFWQMSSSFGLQVTEGAGLDERAYGLLMALNGAMIVLLELPLTSFTRRFPAPRMMAVGYAIVGIGMGINLFAANLPVLILCTVVFTIGEMIALPIANSHIAGLAPEDMRGRYLGVVSITWSSATLVGPAMGLALYQYNPPVLWVVMAGIGLLAGLLILFSGPDAEECKGAVGSDAEVLPVVTPRLLTAADATKVDG